MSWFFFWVWVWEIRLSILPIWELWSRIWGVYELATYLREDKVKPVNLMPVAMSVVILLMCISGMLMMIPYQAAHHEVVSDWRYWADSARGARGTIGWATLFKVVAFVAAIASVCFPIVFYVGIGVIRNVHNLKSQLSGFSVRKSNCFCCMCNHRNPGTGQPVPCDRDAVFKMLQSWYSEKDDKEEEYLDRFDDTWIMPDRLFVFFAFSWYLKTRKTYSCTLLFVAVRSPSCVLPRVARKLFVFAWVQ